MLQQLNAVHDDITCKTAADSAKRCCSMLAVSREQPCSQASFQPVSAASKGSRATESLAPRHCSTAATSASLKPCNSREGRLLDHTRRCAWPAIVGNLAMPWLQRFKLLHLQVLPIFVRPDATQVFRFSLIDWEQVRNRLILLQERVHHKQVETRSKHGSMAGKVNG